MPRGPLALRRFELGSQRRMIGVLGVQQRGAQLEVALQLGAGGIGQPGFRYAGPGPCVAGPQGQRFFEAEQGPGKTLVIARAVGLAQLRVGPGGKRDAFHVRVILADRRLKVLHAGVALGRVRGHGPVRDVNQLAGLVGRLDIVAGGRQQAFLRRLAVVRAQAGGHFVEDAAQQVDVAGRADQVERTGDHLRRHVRRRASHALRAADKLRVPKAGRGQRQSPVHHQHLAEVAEHDVLGLQVAVHDAVGMRERDGVGHLHQDFEILGQRTRADDVRPGRPLHAFHRVEQRVVLVGP